MNDILMKSGLVGVLRLVVMDTMFAGLRRTRLPGVANADHDSGMDIRCFTRSVV